MVDHIATETLTLALEAKTGIRQPQHAKTPPDNTPLAAETLRDYVGDYTTLAGFARIQNCGKRLCAEVADQRFNLVRGNDGLFRLDYSLLGIFHIDLGSLGEIGFLRRTVDGRDLLVARAGTQEILAGQRITLPAHLDAWKSRLGDYEIMNLDADQQFANRIRATGKQGYIFVEMTESAGNIMRIPLQPVSDTEALLLGPLNDGGETIRVVMMEGNERLLFSGYQLRKIER